MHQIKGEREFFMCIIIILSAFGKLRKENAVTNSDHPSECIHNLCMCLCDVRLAKKSAQKSNEKQ